MGISVFEHVSIKAINAVVPRATINIDDEIEYFNNDRSMLERNKKILDLGTRHVADDRTTNSDLCLAAAEDLLDNIDIDRNVIDCLIVASSSHDYHYPASACILHDKLELKEDCSCFDIGGLSCSAYVHGLWLSHSLVASGAAKCCLLLSGDIVSRHSLRENRNSNMLFGDAGSATLVEYTPKSIISRFLTGTRGSGWRNIVAPAGGYAIPVEEDIVSLKIKDDNGNVWRMTDDIMRGFELFKFSTDVGPKGVKRLLDEAGLTVDDIDYFAFHQANGQIVRSIARMAGIACDKFSTETFSTYGNAGAAAVTLDICRQLSRKKAGRILLATFGVGLSWGFALLDTRNTTVYPIELYDTPDNQPTRQQRIEYWIDYFKGGKSDERI